MELTAEVRRFIEGQRVARLATVDAAGRPHLVPVCFALAGDRIYSAVDEEPKRSARLQRLRNIEANHDVAILFDVYSDDWERLAWAMVRGPALVLEAGDEHVTAVRSLRARYPQYERMALDERPVIRIEPARVTTWGFV